jgi:hypothetical protein
VLNYSWMYAAMWTMAKRVMPQAVLERILFPSIPELLTFFDPQHLLKGMYPPFPFISPSTLLTSGAGPTDKEHGGTVSYTYSPSKTLLNLGGAPPPSRTSSFESIYEVFYSVPATPRPSQPTTPVPGAAQLPPPEWLSMTTGVVDGSKPQEEREDESTTSSSAPRPYDEPVPAFSRRAVRYSDEAHIVRPLCTVPGPLSYLTDSTSVEPL